jgi:long-chain fatty acid transport protein
MRKRVRQSTVFFACLAAGLGAAGMAQATNGYFSHGYGTTAKGLAGAGVAFSQDSQAAATNPAGMVHVGDRIDLGIALFSPRREYTVTGNPSGFPGTFGLQPGKVKSGSDYHLIPHFGWNKMLDADSSVGLTVYGKGGMNTDYPTNAMGGTFYAGETGVNLMQLFVAPTYARNLGAVSVGIAPIVAYQRFSAKGLGSFADFSTDPANLSDRGNDSSWGWGVRLGVQGEVAPGFRVGASYQTKMSMGEFDSYRGLFAEQGGFDIPANLTVGMAWDVTPTSTVVFDVQRIWFSDIDSIGNPIMPNLGGCMMGNPAMCLGGDEGPGFGWKDVTVAKIGYQWQSSPDWTWRLGYSYGKQPIRDSEVLFNILAPAVMEHHLTFGFTRSFGSDNELNFAAMYAPSVSQSGANPLEAPGQQEIELKMRQFEIEASYAWKF